jgi:hypothetical protein
MSGGSGANGPGGRRSGEDLPDYSVTSPEEMEQAVDVYVDAPIVKVDEIKLEIDHLRAHLALVAEVGNFVQLDAGAGVQLGKAELDIKDVETQAVLEVRLEHVTKILARVLTTLDRNPELLGAVGDALGQVGQGARSLLTDTGDAVQSAGRGAGRAVADVGHGAGRGVSDIGQGAERGVEGVGHGAERGVEGVGEGAERGVEGVGEGAERGVEGVGRGAGKGVEELGDEATSP